jgi:hypothetical protein
MAKVVFSGDFDPDPKQKRNVERNRAAEQRSVRPADVDRRPDVLGAEQPDNLLLDGYAGGPHRLGEERGLAWIGHKLEHRRRGEVVVMIDPSHSKLRCCAQQQSEAAPILAGLFGERRERGATVQAFAMEPFPT